MNDDWTFADLFAGIGGFHAALSRLGGRCVLAVEKDEEAARVYEANWDMDPRGDVTSIEWDPELQVDVLCAGFPCQPFSKSGAQRGMDEARGTLFFDICRALEAWSPSLVLLENVRNLAGPRHKHEWDVIVRSLRELGYAVSAEPLVVSPNWLSPEEGGRPQNRERVFIVGTWVGAEKAMAEPASGMSPTVEVDRWKGDWDLARDLPLDEKKGVLAEDEEVWVEAWDSLVQRLRAAGVRIPSWPLWSDEWNSSSSLVAGFCPAWKRRFVELNRSWYLENQALLDEWLADWDVRGFPASRRKFEWQAQEAATLRECLIQMRPSGLRAKRATYTGALVAIDQRPIVGALGRRLNVRECARLQGFPEAFSFDVVSERAAYKQLGNSVCVSVVEYVLRSHLASLGWESPRPAVGSRAVA